MMINLPFKNQRANQKKQLSKYTRGFTLIELMISITILSLLLFTGSYSYSLMSERWSQELGQFASSAHTAKNLENFQRLLEGVHSFVVVDDNKKPSFFFIGSPDSLLAVSRNGLFSHGFPEIFRLTTRKKANDLVDLVYQSTSTEQLLLTGTQQEINFTHELTLFMDLDQVQFQYFGWQSLPYKRNDADLAIVQQWYSDYSGIDKQLMPQQIEVVLTKENKKLSFPIHLEQKPEKWLGYYTKDIQ